MADKPRLNISHPHLVGPEIGAQRNVMAAVAIDEDPGAINRHHGIGWEFVHVCIDDASRVAFVQVMPDQHKESAVAFLEAALAYFAKLGVRVERVMTDNGSCYRSKSFRAACKHLGLRQIFTRPYTPKTNGKTERFIQTALREWAYAQAYQNSDQRTAELPNWLHRYNWHRPHGSLGQHAHQPTRFSREQPLEAPQLVRKARSKEKKAARPERAGGRQKAG